MSSGLPLLSGSPPLPNDPDAEIACRKCNKEFNFLFTRSRRCNHCGYAYCSNCTDYQALMPREGQQSGYDSMNVCAFCIEFLQITAAGKGQLKSMPLAKLKKYAGVYNIRIDRAVEKDDLIEAIMSVRQPNGCLPLANETYYRNYSVPNRSSARPRGLFSSRPPPTPNPPTGPPRPSQRTRPEFARPDLAQDPPPVPPRPQQNYQYNYQPRYNNQPPHAHQTHYTHPPPPPPPQSSRPGPYQRPTAARSSHNLNTNTPPRTPPRPRASSTHRPATSPAAAAAPTPPPPPPPSLDELVDMSESTIASLPISALKQVLFDNHVNARLILEKGDLVKRVVGLVEDERRERVARERREAIERGELIEDDEPEGSEEEEVAEEIEELTPRRRNQPVEQADVQREVSQAGANDETGQPLESSAHESALASSSPESINVLSADAPVSPPPAIPVSPSPELTSSTSLSISESSASPTPPTTSPTPPPPPPKTESPLPPPPPPLKTHAKPKKPHVPVERSGLCVICQDEDANIAIVDCGHLAMCRACSELVMTSSRECPLCRTRIVTEQRLLRIFKT